MWCTCNASAGRLPANGTRQCSPRAPSRRQPFAMSWQDRLTLEPAVAYQVTYQRARARRSRPRICTPAEVAWQGALHGGYWSPSRRSLVIAIDTAPGAPSSLGEPGADVEAADEALSQGAVVLPPLVVTELMSDAKASRVLSRSVAKIPLLSPKHG